MIESSSRRWIQRSSLALAVTALVAGTLTVPAVAAPTDDTAAQAVEPYFTPIELEEAPDPAPKAVSAAATRALELQRPLATKADYSSVKNLAISLSYPLYKGGASADPRSRVPGGSVNDKDHVTAPYLEAKAKARAAGILHGSFEPSWANSSYANCSAYTASVVINTVDPTFPGNFVRNQLAYVKDSSNGWEQVGISTDLDRSTLKPGDIFLSEAEPGQPGHTWMWIGEHEGVQNVISQASYAGAGLTAQMPELKIDPLLSGTDGKDSRGRIYSVWRYTSLVKTPGSKIGITDRNADGKADLYAVHTKSGDLVAYEGKGTGQFKSAARPGVNLPDSHVVTPGDYNGDGIDDLIAQDEKTGKLWLYAGTKAGSYKPREQIGKGFKTIRSLMSPGDFNGDGYPDLIGIHKTTHKLVMWPGTGAGKFRKAEMIGTGWKNMEVASGADVNGDGRADILAKGRESGILYLYPGNAAGQFKKRIKLSEDFKERTFMSPGDLNRDGYGDVVSRDNRTGKLYLYEGGNNGKLSAPRQIGTGWNTLSDLS